MVGTLPTLCRYRWAGQIEGWVGGTYPPACQYVGWWMGGGLVGGWWSGVSTTIEGGCKEDIAAYTRGREYKRWNVCAGGTGELGWGYGCAGGWDCAVYTGKTE